MTTEAVKSHDEPTGGAVSEEAELKQRIPAIALEFSKRLFEAQSTDEVYYLLTNDLRAVIAFDRALLITNFTGRPTPVAVTNHPTLKVGTEFNLRAEALAQGLKGLKSGMFLSAGADRSKISQDPAVAEAGNELLKFVEHTHAEYVLCAPLTHTGVEVGRLILEFHGPNAPRQIEILSILSLAPIFAGALVEKWVIHTQPETMQVLATGNQPLPWWKRIRPAYVIPALAVLAILFFRPISDTVGGECEVTPRQRYFAFVKTDGVIEKIFVKEGSEVQADQMVATMDPRDLEFEKKTAQRKLEILTEEMRLLQRESAQDPSKLAESKLAQLKRMGIAEELEYLKRKAEFLIIRTPMAGIVTSKDVETFVGKKFRAGEPFCEIAAPGEMWVDIYVPEERIGFVKKGQPAWVYLNTEPDRAFGVEVGDISPTAQVMPRLGAVYRVSAPFAHPPVYLKVGLKGIGKIETRRVSALSLIARRLLSRWNQLSIYF